MSGGLTFSKDSEIPEGMRKLLEEQKNRASQPVITTAPKAEQPTRKYHNKPTERVLDNGEVVKFDSKKEASYYDYLMVLLKTKQIRNLKLQYQIPIKPSYIDGVTGERLRSVNYIADFVFEKLEDGEWVEHIVDTKGMSKGKGTKTNEFIMKRKILAERGTNIEIV